MQRLDFISFTENQLEVAMINCARKLTICILLSGVLLMMSCIVREVESLNLYKIDNQSSFELFYEPVDNINTTSLKISLSEIREIGNEITLGNEPITADEFFFWRSSDSNADIFLTRDSAGIQIPALQLNTTGILDWELATINRRRSGNTYEHTLIVTDELIR